MSRALTGSPIRTTTAAAVAVCTTKRVLNDRPRMSSRKLGAVTTAISNPTPAALDPRDQRRDRHRDPKHDRQPPRAGWAYDGSTAALGRSTIPKHRTNHRTGNASRPEVASAAAKANTRTPMVDHTFPLPKSLTSSASPSRSASARNRNSSQPRRLGMPCVRSNAIYAHEKTLFRDRRRASSTARRGDRHGQVEQSGPAAQQLAHEADQLVELRTVPPLRL